MLINCWPLVSWGSFWPVWGKEFNDGKDFVWPVWNDGKDFVWEWNPFWNKDFVLRLTLSVWSCCLMCAYVFYHVKSLLYICCRRPGTYGTGYTKLVFVMYATTKIVAQYLLLSDFDRLCPGDIGKTFASLQGMEIFSVSSILFFLFLHPNGRSGYFLFVE